VTWTVDYTVDAQGVLPTGITASARWDPIEGVAFIPEPADEASVDASPTVEPDPSPTPRPAIEPGQSPTPEPTIEPGPSPTPEPPDLGVVQPEQLGDVVAPEPLQVDERTLAIALAAPTAPGRYRLTVTLHDADGVAYDASTQALLPSLLVRVTAGVDGEIVAPTAAVLDAGAPATLSLWAVNLGVAPWGHEQLVDGCRWA
jgi:hypothetical protein